MARMTGGQAIVRSLIDYGVDTIFGIPGVQMDGFFNALYDERNSVRAINTRHEQGCAYMAYGYAFASGRVGVCAVVPGPGLLNATAALSTAYACNTPVLCVSGQIPSAFIGRGVGLLHEIPDQMAMVRSVAKWAGRANHPAEAPGVVREAFRQMATGRPRPVEIEMAMDIMHMEAEVSLLDPVTDYPTPPLDADRIEDAAKILGKAENPIIFAGGGVVGAEAELQALAETLQAPVVLSRGGLGAIDSRHYLAQNLQAAHRLWNSADVVLGVGTRLNPIVPGWGVDADLKIIRIDIDPVEITRVNRPAVGIVGDAKSALAALAERTAAHNLSRASREDELTTLKAAVLKEFHDKLHPQMMWLAAIRDVLPEDGIFVEELTQPGYVARFTFPIHRTRSYVTPGYQGTLGYGFATALGVKVACPDRPVVAISGDGGFMYNVQELSTAVQQQIGLVTVVFADGAFGNVKRMQIEDYGGKTIATGLHNPDFVRMAESFGAQGLRAETPDALRAALKRGFETPGPTIIEVPVGEMPSPWGMIQLPRAR